MRQAAILWLVLLFTCLAGKAQSGAPDYQRLIKLKKGYTVYPYPNKGRHSVAGFSVMDPGLALVPLRGGLFVPAFSNWLLMPDTTQPIIGSTYLIDEADTSLLLLKVDLSRRKVVVQKTKYLHLKDSAKGVFNMPLSRYDIRACNTQTFFLWGDVPNGSALWKSDFKSVTSLFTSSLAIRDVDFINENNLLLAVDSTIIGVGLKKSPQVLFKMDFPAESVCIDKLGTGAVYVSTPAGILRFNSLEEDNVDVVTERIHGKIRIYQNKLFVLWSEMNQVIEIMLK